METQILVMAAVPLALLKKTMYEKEEQSRMETPVHFVQLKENHPTMIKTLVFLNVEMGESIEVYLD